MNWMEYVNAFWVGGAICAVCQVFIDKTKLTPARILVSLVVIGVFLQADVYKRQVLRRAGRRVRQTAARLYAAFVLVLSVGAGERAVF